MTLSPLENKFYGRTGYLFPYDVRYDADDRAHCNPLPDGRVQFRLFTEPALVEAILVYNDGSAKGTPMEPILASQESGLDRRFIYWEATIRPMGRRLKYHFALKDRHGRPVYYCRHGVDHTVERLDRWLLDLDTQAFFETPAWMHGALVYQIFPDRFANGDPGNDRSGTVAWGSAPHWFEYQGGDLAGIIERLDYLEALGVDALYLNPIFAAGSNHRYDTVDYYRVDPVLGGNEALRALVNALHERDMRIILDASFNHCHPRFFAFQDVVRHGPDSPYADWFTIHEFPVVLRYRPALLTGYWRHRITFAPDNLGVPVMALDWTDADGTPFELTYRAWYGIPDMPELNLRNPDTRRYFLDVSAFWLCEYRIDGWRMDVARHIEDDFWREFRSVAKAASPDCFLLSEIWGDTSPWLQGDSFDATMNYVLRDLVLDYFARLSMDTPTFVDGLLRALSLYAPQATAVAHNLISSHDTERFLTVCNGSLPRFKLATLLQLTLPGAPGVYYGDEIGMEGESDPDCRRAFPWDQPQRWRPEVLEMVKGLAHLRRIYPALRYGDFYLIWQSDDGFAFLRRFEGQRVLVIINRGQALERLELPVAASAPGVLWGDVHVTARGEKTIVQGLPAENGAVIDLL